MQRQSLGSPVSKLHGHGGLKEESLIVEDDPKRKDILFASSSSSSSSSSSAAASSSSASYEDDRRAAKPRRLSSSSSSSLSHPPLRPDRFIHLIPLLTLLCFLVLFLFSHTPSQSDMAQFKGFKWPANRIDSAENEIGDIGRFTELRKSDVLAIRSLRNLQEIQKQAPKSRYHRKFADF